VLDNGSIAPAKAANAANGILFAIGAARIGDPTAAGALYPPAMGAVNPETGF
jgi:hypothetical protein